MLSVSAEDDHMDRKWGPSSRLVCLLVLVFSLGAGAAFAAGAMRPEANRPEVVPATPEFDSPRVARLPVGEARRVLNERGYDVMVVGRGEVVLQELGFEGQLLRIEGERRGPQRYCASSAERCVPVGS